MIINKRKNLNLDTNMTGNICTHLTLRHIHIIIVAMETKSIIIIIIIMCLYSCLSYLACK